jgi:hypothetical protein
MADRETWVARVAEWKASGLSSPAFCEGKDFTAGGLRHWAHRLTRGDDHRPAVRIGRVVRLARASKVAEPALALPAIVVELGAARVTVRPGVDRATLAAVLEILTTAVGSAR